MKRALIFLFIITITISFFIIPKVKTFANDTAMGLTPEGVYPITQSDIMMEAEEINIKLLNNYKAKVTCRFDFKNFGEAQQVVMGFPAMLNEEITEFALEDSITVRNFTAKDEDGDILVSLVDTIPKPPLKDWNELEKYSKWYSFKVDFEKGEAKTLYHTYEITFTAESSGNVYMGYVIETGAAWKGPIGHSKVIFDMGEIPIYCITEISPNNFYGIEGNKLIWERRNYEPTYNLWVTYNTRFNINNSTPEYFISEAEKKSELFNIPVETIKQNSQYYYDAFNNFDPIEAVYIKSILGLPDGSSKPIITDCLVSQEGSKGWRFKVLGTDSDADIADFHADIEGIENYTYREDTWRDKVYYDAEEKKFYRNSYILVEESKPFTITFIMTDAAGNYDTKTLILQNETPTPEPIATSTPTITPTHSPTPTPMPAIVGTPTPELPAEVFNNTQEATDTYKIPKQTVALITAIFIIMIIFSLFTIFYLLRKGRMKG